MSQLSDYLENAVLDHINGVAALTQPTPYLALSTANPTDDASGLAEPSGNGYAREAITFGAASGGTASNSVAITYTASGGNWGTITYVAIFDALTAGNMLWHGPMSASKIVNDGDSLTFAIGELDVSLD